MSQCRAELCPMWDGEGCSCDLFGGTFTIVLAPEMD